MEGGRGEMEGGRWRGDGGRTGGDGRRGRQESEGEICKEQNMYTEM